MGAAPADDPGHSHRKQRCSGGVLQPLPIHSGGQCLVNSISQNFFLAISRLALFDSEPTKNRSLRGKTCFRSVKTIITSVAIVL